MLGVRSQYSGDRRQEIIFIYSFHTPHPTPHTPLPTSPLASEKKKCYDKTKSGFYVGDCLSSFLIYA
ncbi:hypothetical protein O53_659 [Microcystis aeruginosa TAIHU98]|uniref:Uncharacterized protein n=1 Tax=Microcystis aeruginosa TAIHU98 TaxID=1134457 RepID=L7E9E9_MICAE|nr:hypothetical protein O53_659 [Microcystis aeruginosa TAIHU98]